MGTSVTPAISIIIGNRCIPALAGAGVAVAIAAALVLSIQPIHAQQSTGASASPPAAAAVSASPETSTPAAENSADVTAGRAPAATTTYTSDFKRFQTETFTKAVKYFFQKKYEMAELLLQKELQENPENYFAYSYLGDIFLYKKQYDEAISLYKKSLDLYPQNAEDHFRLGQAYYYKGIGNLALTHYETAYSLNPNLRYVWYQIGLTHLIVLRDKEKTIASWEQFLRLSPEDPQYEKVRRAIELLKDPAFVIPQPGSDVPLEEALHLGGAVLQPTERQQSEPADAGHEQTQEISAPVDPIRDDDL